MMMSIRVKSRAWTDVSTSAVLMMSRSQATAGQATAGQASIADHHRGFSCTCLLGRGGGNCCRRDEDGVITAGELLYHAVRRGC